MFYLVRAQLKEDAAGEFRRRLLDDTIASQQPDGQEMVDAMNRAVVPESGEIEWSEVCYCQPPLAHERRTVLDHYFSDISTEEIDGYREHQGRPFMDYLATLVGSPE